MRSSAIIIDDEANNIDNLKELLRRHCRNVNVVATANNAVTGRDAIVQHKPEIVFLDVQLPGKNGFELLQSLPGLDFEIIFVTAFQQYGIQAIKFSAIDYLLKPVNVPELQAAVEKAIRKRLQDRHNLQLENMVALLQNQQPKSRHSLALPTAKEIRFARIEEIIRCESVNNYTSFYFVNGEKLLVSKPIYEYDEMLSGYGFVRCHQSHLVNKAYVKSWVKQDGDCLLLSDKTVLPVSRLKKASVRDELLKR